MTNPTTDLHTITLRPEITIDRQRLSQLCDRWQITELQLFGSILRDDFHADSDIDLLVTWDDQNRWTLLDLVDMHDDFAQLLGRPVDLVSQDTIETSNNYLRRAAILNSVQPLYRKS